MSTELQILTIMFGTDFTDTRSLWSQPGLGKSELRPLSAKKFRMTSCGTVQLPKLKYLESPLLYRLLC